MKAWLVLWCLSRAQECQDGCGAQFLQLKAGTQLTEHPWPHARGRIPLQDGTTPETVSTGQKNWSWHDPLGPGFNLMAGGPVIDKDGNVFQNTQKGLHAFSREGDKLWFYDTPGMSNNEVTLYGDLVLGTTETGHAFALERTTGQPRWVTKFAEDAGPDVGYPAAGEGVFVIGANLSHHPPQEAGNTKVMGLDVHNGDKLWEYEPDLPVWNLTPFFVGDGSIVFMDFAGGTYRLNLTSGEAIWRNLPADSRRSFSDGGAGLGPNDMIYTCSNQGTSLGEEGTLGIVRAFHLVNGSEAWHHITQSPCCTYPAIGKLAGVESLAVVVTPGPLPIGSTWFHASILALDAQTGQELWSLSVPPHHGPNSVGDNLIYAAERFSQGVVPICLPAHWSSPLIDGAGHVHVGRVDGKLYKVFGFGAFVEDEDVEHRDGLVVKSTQMNSGFLHGAMAAAPGMFAVSTCDTLRVYLQ